MSAKRKTWKEKLADSKDLPKVVEISPNMAGRWGAKTGDTVAIPSPMEVDAIMKTVPQGKLITINDIRKLIAQKHNATIGCPITTGIFARIAAEAAAEDIAEGKSNATPYWRTLKAGGEINEKYPGGVEAQAKLLEAEGHKVSQKGKKWVVPDYEKYLIKI